MVFSSLQVTADWIIAHGYILMFLLMMIEGPVITAAGAFVAALGLFNIWIVLILSIFGNLIPDIIFYSIGYFGREKFINKYQKYLGLKKGNIEYLENMINTHAIKSLVLIKLVPFLATPGLIMVGLTKMDIKKYIKWSLIITVPSSLIYLIIGYYFGTAYDKIEHYMNIGGYLIVTFLILFFIIMHYIKKFYQKVAFNIGE